MQGKKMYKLLHISCKTALIHNTETHIQATSKTSHIQAPLKTLQEAIINNIGIPEVLWLIQQSHTYCMNISWKFNVKSKKTTPTFYNLSQITYLEETLQTCSRADLCSRLSWRLYTKSRAVITLSLFWALSASTWGSGPQLTSFVLHSSNLRSALSVREHGARLIGCNSKLNINILNWLLNAHNQNMRRNVSKTVVLF